jgi:beta-barrel assembly-enhancing protease
MRIRFPVAIIIFGAVLGGCVMAPGDPQLVADGGHSKKPPVAAATEVTGGIGIATELMPWETGYDPYAYRDVRPGSRPSLDSEEAGMWLVAEKHERKLRTSGNRITDEKINSYISGIVCRLAGPYCPDFRVYVVNVPRFNAFMTPNGTMVIWTGFLLRVRNEAQMAAVLGHEIGHFIRRHSLQRQQDTVNKANFLTFLNIGLAAAGAHPGVSDIAQLIAMGSIQAFNRDNERESDLVGITLMHRYGYDVREAPKIWHQITKEFDRSGGSMFLASHPPDKEREANLKRAGERLQKDAGPGSTGKERFIEIIQPWRKRFLEDEVKQGSFKSTLRLMGMLYEDGVNRAEIKYFEGEVYRRRGKTGDEKKASDWAFVPTEPKTKKKDLRPDTEIALEIFHQALEEDGDVPPEIHRSIALIHQRHGDRELAKRSLRRYLELAPNAPDRKVIQFMLTQSS